MDRLKPWLLAAVLFGPPFTIIMILDTPEAAGARAGLLIAVGLCCFFTGFSFIADYIRKGGQ